ncbi:acyl-CoA dehydrogenase family protein [Frankia sp. CNm7]|uniref:Acyl-[acyl-carrier-protein] dehydrogenase MbtN n=1 Tax=Frankia nepalensis TaxID=1836974 RepID=A0A937RED0_9ACTN|nr:acyl-CoA dehydrogenase family protein [Frankia nepalensis]MBL7496690.1 acyl-CoA dehydrogenase family protein [Frankia nepalensis]MBL7511080.1 acyl-CoA dehydrogenase family protein [Frankia nepalensis]MBL7516698.1 acyl-CoA dehydrogenase family protein [Frankia nepalensis]MBL7627430.1 acyl-CoA dehydrogenase family protein [Frankia nepalensis]
MRRELFGPDHEALRQTARTFVEREVIPHQDAWLEKGLVDRSAWLAAGAQGLLGIAAPAEYGGAGEEDYRYRMVLIEELARVGAASFNAGTSAQDDLVVPYLRDLGTPEQKASWLPRLCAGEAIGALAMTEPDAGSDLQGIRTSAVRDGDGWRLSGGKTFITNGILADVVIVFARTDPDAGSRGFSLFLVESAAPGFRHGRKLEKLGLRGNDTAELFFDDIALPATALLGTEGRGLIHLMERLPLERLSIAATSYAFARAAYTWTVDYCFGRRAFGKPIGDFQNTRFTLAELATELDVAEIYLDRAILALGDGSLSAVDAAKAKWWLTDLQNRVVDRCVQLHGGYGFMWEYPITRAYADARIQPIFGGTNEIMKEIIGRDIARQATAGGRNV